MNQQLITIGMLVVFVGIALVIVGSLIGAKTADRTQSKVAVGGIIGFIPFGFGNDKRLVIAMIAITVLLFVLFAIFSRTQ
jgi:uncharacterized protein (TIGR00304 family)